MIFLDKPFQVDDWIEIDNMAGTVLEVGFRSTRIQQLDTSIISIPNGIISNKALVNKGLRVSRLFETTIGLAYDTPRHYLEAYIHGLREIAKVHPKITGNQYIYLKSLGSYSIDVLFRVYLKTDVYAEELELKEQLLFQMMALADTLGVRFAFPSQTLYIEQFPEKKNEIPTYGATKENLHKKLDGFFRVWNGETHSEKYIAVNLRDVKSVKLNISLNGKLHWAISLLEPLQRGTHIEIEGVKSMAGFRCKKNIEKSFSF